MPDPIPISALQHYLFCPRQCALIHVDGLWAENRLTVEGTLLHARVDRPGGRGRSRPAGQREAGEPMGAGPPGAQDGPGYRWGAAGRERQVLVRVERALPILCERLGLIGKADSVEFPLDTSGTLAGPPRPVEHKRGRPKRIDADRVQLCAQAMCLEEMLGLPEGGVIEGELFYHAVRRRERVPFDRALRERTTSTIEAVRRLITSNTVPRVDRAPKCRSCSLVHLCLPAGTGPSRSPRLYLSRAIGASLAATDP